MSGCAEMPTQPVLRPIPPPPPSPPPGMATVIYAPITNAAPAAVPNTLTNAPNYEVSSNFVASGQVTNGGSSAVAVASAPPGTPQYELIPPRPGPGYVWRDGFWRWSGAGWAWMPGFWEEQAPAVIFVEPGFGFGYHYRPYGGPWRHGPGRYRRW
jgi:hypothetical protein